ncbi:hypothetical protein ABE096_15955 [Robertmurraya massiliosenegalensis]|uniref:UPF0738 family protein n=1 Tax=Robertmurraya TaxID=2837507 RepID=UPI0039A40EF0
MREKINVVSATVKNKKELHLMVEREIKIEQLQPLGQMLVDSDETSFIYLLEKDDEYTYLGIKEDIWTLLKNGMDEKYTVFLTNESSQCELSSFYDELEYLVENIKGNGNYGEKMVTKVEACF